MDKFVTREKTSVLQKRKLPAELANQFLSQEHEEEKPAKKPWFGWSKQKKQEVAKVLGETSYAHLKVYDFSMSRLQHPPSAGAPRQRLPPPQHGEGVADNRRTSPPRPPHEPVRRRRASPDGRGAPRPPSRWNAQLQQPVNTSRQDNGTNPVPCPPL